MLRLILSVLGLTAVTVVIHGAGTEAARERVIRLWTRRRSRPGRLGAELVMAELVSLLLLLHLAEALVWALFFRVVGGLPDLESAVYFSLTSYTTVGYGDATPTDPIGRLVGAAIMLIAVASLSILTAFITSAFVEARQAERRAIADAEETAHRQRLESQLAELVERLERIEQQGATRT